jgi:signal transduction histidine kinase
MRDPSDGRRLTGMDPRAYPEAINTRLVFRIYALVAITCGVLVYLWPAMYRWPAVPFDPGPYDLSDPRAHGAGSILRVVAATVVAFGCCASAFAVVDDPLGRRRVLIRFAVAHLVFGGMFLIQWQTILSYWVPPAVGLGPFVVGLVLLYLGITAAGSGMGRLAQLLPVEAGAHPHLFAVRNKRAPLARLRSQYEEQIRQAARQEERARLARDLHDAVKQQLFAIQTAAATAQARFETDADGAKTAVEQVRTSAREAMTEMEAMLEQLQAAPLENTGLVSSLKKHCEALGFRTGAEVTFELGTLPPDAALMPGAREAIFRVAQESLANVARHARARRVRVSLGVTAGRLVLTIGDDGSGLREERNPGGMGMANMAARAAEVGGDFEAVSAPNQGTTVRFSVPTVTDSARPYIIRAIWWGAVLIAAAVHAALRVSPGRPWGATAVVITGIAVVAGIAVARYAVASYRVLRARAVP